MALGIAVVTLAAAVMGAGEPPSSGAPPTAVARVRRARTAGGGELVIGPDFRVAATGRGGPRVARAAQRLVVRLARQTGLALPWRRGRRARRRRWRSAACGQALGERRTSDATPRRSRPDAPSSATNRGVCCGGSRRSCSSARWLRERVPRACARCRGPAALLVARTASRLRSALHERRDREAHAGLDGRPVKLNVLHWHLSDDDFRVERRRYPALH